MTDTPDALIDDFGKRCLASCGGSYIGAELLAARETLRARLTAGDAAIADKKIIGDTLAATVVQLNDTQAELDEANTALTSLKDQYEKLVKLWTDTRDRAEKAEAALDVARAEIEKLRVALQPFARPEYQDALGGQVEGDVSPMFGRNGHLLTLGDFRAARAALASKETNNG